MLPRKITITARTNSRYEYKNVLNHVNDVHDWRDEYHDLFASKFGFKYVYSFSAGRTALYVILKSLDIGEGDEIVLQGYTCAAVPKPIILCGATPVYIDILKDDYSMDYSMLEKSITSKTRAVIVQHTYGIPSSSVDKIRQFCDDKGLILIEDCAHAIGVYDEQGRVVGSVGDVAFYSTDHTKIMSTSIGGLVATNNGNIGEKLNNFYLKTPELSDNEELSVAKQFRLFYLMYGKWLYWLFDLNFITQLLRGYIYKFFMGKNKFFFMEDFCNFNNSDYTFPAKLSNVQAWIGINQLKDIDGNINGRRNVLKWYNKYLSKEKQSKYSPMLVYPIEVNDTQAVIRKLRNICRVERMFSLPIHCIQESELELFKLDLEDVPIAVDTCEHIINLPMNPSLSEREVAKICKIVNNSI